MAANGKGRPRPVLIFGATLVVLTAITTYADAVNLIGEGVLNWTRFVTVIGGALWTFYVQSVVTPVSDPVGRDGTPLVPKVTKTETPGRQSQTRW